MNAKNPNTNLIELRWTRGVLLQFRIAVFVVNEVADPDELLRPVRARQQHHRDADSVVLRYPAHVRRVRLKTTQCTLILDTKPTVYLKDEHVFALGNGADEHGIQNLVVLLAFGRPDVDHLPLQIYETTQLMTGPGRVVGTYLLSAPRCTRT